MDVNEQALRALAQLACLCENRPRGEQCGPCWADEQLRQRAMVAGQRHLFGR